MRASELFQVLVRVFGVSLVASAISYLLMPLGGMLGMLMVGIVLLATAGLLTRALYGRE